MKIKLLLLITLLGFGQLRSQEVNFLDTSLHEAQKLSILENKMIFLDGYTTWCEPCKTMDNEVFSTKEAADYFNVRFVNVKFNMEQGEGIDIKKKYNITMYPTFLILDNDLNEIYRISGATTVDRFIDKVDRGMKSEYNLFRLQEMHKSGTISVEQKLDLYHAFNDVHRKDDAYRISIEILNETSKEGLLKEEFWPILSNVSTLIIYPQNLGIILENLDDLNAKYGDEVVEEVVNLFYLVACNKFFCGNEIPSDEFLSLTVGYFDNYVVPNMKRNKYFCDLLTAKFVEKNPVQIMKLLGDKDKVCFIPEMNFLFLLEYIYKFSTTDNDLIPIVKETLISMKSVVKQDFMSDMFETRINTL